MSPIPDDARWLGPGMYADDTGGFHVDFDEFIRETGGNPQRLADRRAAESALKKVAAEHGIPFEVRLED